MKNDKDFCFDLIKGQVVEYERHLKAAIGNNGNPFIDNDDIFKAYEQNFRQQCHLAGRKIDYPFELYLRVYTDIGSVRNDVTTTVLECLKNCKAIKATSLCYKIVMDKVPAHGDPHIAFVIKRLIQEPDAEESICVN